jgi:hypothetical protein
VIEATFRCLLKKEEDPGEEEVAKFNANNRYRYLPPLKMCTATTLLPGPLAEDDFFIKIKTAMCESR